MEPEKPKVITNMQELKDVYQRVYNKSKKLKRFINQQQFAEILQKIKKILNAVTNKTPPKKLGDYRFSE